MTESGLPFFSIIIPAHNEEKYIAATLSAIANLEYPKERYEVLVVENGSSDLTLETIRAHALPNMRTLSFKNRGVAFARNRGIEQVSTNATWVVFLDADATVVPEFLNEIATHLRDHASVPLGVGGVGVGPIPSTPVAELWFLLFDVLHRVFRHTAVVTIARADLLSRTRFDERLTWMEDLQFVNALKKHAAYFFIPKRLVHTSTRRFQKDGWLWVTLWHILVGALPATLQRKFSYLPVR